MILDDHGRPIPLDLCDHARLDRTLDRVEVPNLMLSLRRRQPILHVLQTIANLVRAADVGEGRLSIRPFVPSTAPDPDPALHRSPAGEGHDAGGVLCEQICSRSGLLRDHRGHTCVTGIGKHTNFDLRLDYIRFNLSILNNF